MVRWRHTSESMWLLATGGLFLYWLRLLLEALPLLVVQRRVAMVAALRSCPLHVVLRLAPWIARMVADANKHTVEKKCFLPLALRIFLGEFK